MPADSVNLLSEIFLDNGLFAVLDGIIHQCRHRWREKMLERVAGQPNNILPRGTLACGHSNRLAFAPVAVWMHCETMFLPAAVSFSPKPEDVEYIFSLYFSAREF